MNKVFEHTNETLLISKVEMFSTTEVMKDNLISLTVTKVLKTNQIYEFDQVTLCGA